MLGFVNESLEYLKNT